MQLTETLFKSAPTLRLMTDKNERIDFNRKTTDLELKKAIEEIKFFVLRNPTFNTVGSYLRLLETLDGDPRLFYPTTAIGLLNMFLNDIQRYDSIAKSVSHPEDTLSLLQ